MFFEYTKGQGGGLVRKITLNKDDKIAIIEFEETGAVDIVLKKRPLQMLGQIVAAEKCVPILGADETLEIIQMSGLPEKFVENVKSMSQSELRQYEPVSFQLVPKTDAHLGIRCEGCGMSPIRGIRYACERFLNLRYNYCENCKLKMNPQQTHKLRKLEVGRYPQDFYHADWCNCCFKIITGSKFRCIKCRDFDICPVCKKEKPHDPDHPWVKF